MKLFRNTTLDQVLGGGFLLTAYCYLYIAIGSQICQKWYFLGYILLDRFGEVVISTKETNGLKCVRPYWATRLSAMHWMDPNSKYFSLKIKWTPKIVHINRDNIPCSELVKVIVSRRRLCLTNDTCIVMLSKDWRVSSCTLLLDTPFIQPAAVTQLWPHSYKLHEWFIQSLFKTELGTYGGKC